jgi:membrane-bound serine protease (ClpP class)
MAVAATKVVVVRRTRPQTGQEELVGQVGVVRQILDPVGLVFVHGELWRARASGEPIRPGETVLIEGIGDGLVLDVRRAEEPATVA